MHESENISTKMDEGSEEGEIMDSDEEQNMRQRIRELEARNDELEKIASISGDYINQYRYPTDYPPQIYRLPFSAVKPTLMSQKDVARIPSDASSISSDEMEPIRKRVKRKGRHSRKEHCKKCRSRSNSAHKRSHRTHKSENKLIKSEDYCRMHNKLRLQKRNSPILTNENYLETISLDSNEDSEPRKLDGSNSDLEDKDTSHHLNRDELRFALARTKETKTSSNLLRERLYNGNALLDHKENINRSDVVIDTLEPILPTNKSNASDQSLEHSDRDECATQEEQELRLIALKSAILKKHLARKKRNAEMAYSPTDFAPVAANPIIADDNMDVVEEELDELNDVMEISPINSPRLMLSPSNEHDFRQSDFKFSGDNNSIDMDIAQSGSEEEFDSNKNDQWCPIDTEPVTKQSKDTNEALNYPLPVHYGIYVPEMQYQLPPPNTMIKHSQVIDTEKSPAPPGTNIYTDFIIDEEPPPPPSMFIEILDEDEPPSPPTVLDTIPSEYPVLKYQEDPPPPPPFFPENENNSNRNNVFQRLGTKTEDSKDNLQFPRTEMESCSLSYTNRIQNEVDIADDDESKESDEEVSALRSFLLSKLQTSKSQKKEHTVKKVSEQFLPNLEIVCHAEDKPDENGIETVLQKALRRLKSNFIPSSSSMRENDNREVRVKEDCLNAATIMVEIVTSNADVEEHKKLSTKSLPRLNKKTTSTKNKIIKKIKSFGSKQASSLDKCDATISSTPIIAEALSDLQTKEAGTCPTTVSESNGGNGSNGEFVSDSSNITETVKVTPSKSNEVENNTNEIKDNTAVCVQIDTINTTKNDQVKTKESREDAVKEKQKQVCLPAPKSSAANENSETKDSNSKKKKLNSGASSTAPARVQPLSAKNSLIPSGISSLKSAQNFLQSTLNKVHTTTRTTKIIRPNKVINKEITTNIKRAMTPTGSPIPPPKIQRTILNTSVKSTSSTLSATDVAPKITVKKLVISLRASDTETSDEELMRGIHVPIDNSIDRIRNSYSEIASPLELLMKSASCSPARNKNSLLNDTSASVGTETPATLSTANAAFEQKLDAFLKGMRKKGGVENITTNESTKCSVIKNKDSAKTFNTPSAVRHLPLASQDEYRRLVHRMKLLEKQKQSKKSDEDISSEASTSKNIPVKNGTTQTEVNISEESAKSALKKNVQLKTLLSYENSFDQTSDNIVKLLNKSLSLVDEAKKVKIVKLRHEKRLQELRAEMARIQILYEQEDRKFSSMKPHIGASNQFLTALKKKRRNLMENANKLGRSLKGDKYRLDNKVGEEIISKSRKLHADIKLVNSMKIENIETMLSHSKSTIEICDGHSNGATVMADPNNKNDVVEERCKQIAPTGSVVSVEATEVQKEVVVEPSSDTQSSVEQTQELENKDSSEHCEEHNKILAKITAEENTQIQTPDPADVVEIVESETQVEPEIQHEDNNITGEEADNQCLENAKSKSVVPVYISPLDHFRHEYRNIDSSAIICPYEMWGKCADECCSYMHMTIGKRRGTELAFKLINTEKL